MDLPPCPVCGEPLRLDEPRGPARCPSCGFLTPVELDTGSLAHALEEARERALGPRPMLTHAREAPELPLDTSQPPSLLESGRSRDLPTLSPPPVPRELVDRAPPMVEDPRTTLEAEKEDAARTTLADERERVEGRRTAELRARGELLR